MKENYKSLGFIIAKTANSLKAKLYHALKPFDITPEQLAVMKTLWDEDGLPQSELANRTFKDPPNTARILDRLVKKKLITRKNNPKDRRSALVFLRKKGFQLEHDILPEIMELRKKLYKSISDEEYDLLIGLLTRILDDL
ncbi:MAG: MarR family transcriptional regulator [Desulfobacteraceae bacterium]|nr:MarR family transcriptional regulator [Desulfobacteraceae bacterium]